MKFLEKAFAGLSVLTVADLLQLTPARVKLIFSQFSVMEFISLCRIN